MLRMLMITTFLATPLAAQQAMDHSTMTHDTQTIPSNAAPTGSIAGMDMNIMTEPGQGAFATIEEIVAALVADPTTDWSVVNIDGLREHLLDMDLVFTKAAVTVSKAENGLTFALTGAGRTALAIQNMVPTHADVMQGVDGWGYSTTLLENGASLTITVPDGDLAKLAGLGIFGVMAQGGHHQAHHWMMASGSNPHQ